MWYNIFTVKERNNKKKKEVKTMTILERLKLALNREDANKDNVDKLMAIAYYIGKEEATKDIIDRHNKQCESMRANAKRTRYHKMAEKVIGKTDIYSPDYAMEATTMFGSDETKL